MPVGKTKAAEMEGADFRAEARGEEPLKARVGGCRWQGPGRWQGLTSILSGFAGAEVGITGAQLR